MSNLEIFKNITENILAHHLLNSTNEYLKTDPKNLYKLTILHLSKMSQLQAVKI